MFTAARSANNPGLFTLPAVDVRDTDASELLLRTGINSLPGLDQNGMRSVSWNFCPLIQPAVLLLKAFAFLGQPLESCESTLPVYTTMGCLISMLIFILSPSGSGRLAPVRRWHHFR